MNANLYQDWIGRTETVSDVATAQAVRAFRATLDQTVFDTEEGDPLPPGAHWIFARPVAPMRALGRDGHPARGPFLPPIALPRRMWAGSRIEFGAPLRVGDRLERVSEILSITPKTGSTGELVFVTLRHTTGGSSGGKVVEQQDLVYRHDPQPGAGTAAGAASAAKAPAVARALAEDPGPAEFSRRVVPDTVLLFRYSALTFNGHRIHYDQEYVTRVEGYQGLVVHGPLLATLMLDLIGREMPAASIASFEFSARRPITLPMAFEVKARRDAGGRACRLWIESEQGVAVAGRVGLRE